MISAVRKIRGAEQACGVARDRETVMLRRRTRQRRDEEGCGERNSRVELHSQLIEIRRMVLEERPTARRAGHSRTLMQGLKERTNVLLTLHTVVELFLAKHGSNLGSNGSGRHGKSVILKPATSTNTSSL